MRRIVVEMWREKEDLSGEIDVTLPIVETETLINRAKMKLEDRTL
jgi:hypothetical protein